MMQNLNSKFTIAVLFAAVFVAGFGIGYSLVPPRVSVVEVPVVYNNTVIVNNTVPVPILVNNTNTTVIYVPVPVPVNNTVVVNNTVIRDNVTYVLGIPAREFTLVMNFTLLENMTLWIRDANGVLYDIRLVCYDKAPYNVSAVENATVQLSVKWMNTDVPQPYLTANFSVIMGLNYSGGWWHGSSGGGDVAGFFDVESRVDMSQSAYAGYTVYFAVYFEYVYTA